MENVFLAVDKRYLGKNLKSVDILILAQIEEFQRNGKPCYVTNQQFSDMFGESESTIKRSLDKLEEMNLIKRTTVYVDGNGRATKQRVITVCDGRFKMNLPNKMEGSKNDDGRFKSEEWKVHNEPIKENKNINKKKNSNSFLSNRDSLQQASDYQKKNSTTTLADHLLQGFLNTISEEHPSKPSPEELHGYNPPHNRRRSLEELENDTVSIIDQEAADREAGLID